MRHACLAVLALAAVVFAACADRKPEVSIEPPEPLVRIEPVAEVAPSVGATVSPPPVVLVPSISTEPAGTVRLSDVLSVTVRVVVKNAIGERDVIADFIAPGPVDYQRKVQRIMGTGGEQTVVFDLPVAGTLIDQQKLTGTWSVRLFVDGEQLSTPTFEIAP
jgi:hypothetical protein